MSRQYEDENIDDPLDAMLRTHLAAKLEPQRGRARLAFETHLAVAPPRQARRPGAPLRNRVWVIGVVGTALAASIAALWAVPIVWRTDVKPMAEAGPEVSQPKVTLPIPQAKANRGGIVPVSTQWEQVSSAVCSVSQDKGVLLIANEVPARVIQQYETQRMQFVCPTRGVRVEIEVPRQTTKLIPLETH